MVLFIVLAIVAIVVFYGIAVYNKLVRFRTLVDEAWNKCAVEETSRFD